MKQPITLNLNNDPIIKAQGICLSIGGRQIFNNLDFSLNLGEAYLLAGTSGSGKSLLLKILSGLIPPSQGTVELAGVNLKEAPPEILRELRIKMGFVFQDAALISNMCLYDNIALPLRYHTSLSEEEVHLKVSEKMSLFRLDRQSYFLLPAQLSLEGRKLGALARALILEPEILFLDEPTTGMGREASLYVWRILQTYRQQKGASLILGQSEWRSALPLADRLGFLKEGRIILEKKTEEVKDNLANFEPDEMTFSGKKEQAYEDAFSPQKH